MKSCCHTSEVPQGRKKKLPLALIVIVALVALLVGVALSQKSFAQGGHDHGGQKAGKSAQPASYAAAVEAIDVRLGNIDHLIDTKKLDAVHEEAEVIREIAKSLAQLALKADSGVPREAVKEVNIAAKALADKFEAIDAAGDSGNLEATKKVYQEMVALQATLKKYASEASYTSAVQMIDMRLKNIERLIEAKKLDAVHSEAEVIRDVANGLAQLALEAGSGVPKDSVKEINIAAKALADKFEAIDAAGDSGNLEATKKVYQEMVALQATLKKYASEASYTSAVQTIDMRLKNIERLIEAKKLDAVHAEAEFIRDVANSLAQLALKAESGVPKEAVKEINEAAKALAGKFERIDAAGDSGNLEATKKAYQEMVALHATLRKYVSEAYQCPMKCEKDKTYSKPGECPVCKMPLKKLTPDKVSKGSPPGTEDGGHKH